MSVEGAPPETQNHPDRDGSRAMWRPQRSSPTPGHPLDTPQSGGWPWRRCGLVVWLARRCRLPGCRWRPGRRGLAGGRYAGRGRPTATALLAATLLAAVALAAVALCSFAI